MSRILITGASGFIGRALVAAFAKAGQPLRAAVRSAPQPPFPAQVEVMAHGDLSQTVDWRPLLDGVDRVVHVAGIAHTRRPDPMPYDRVNRWATEQLAMASAGAGVRQFVFVSSIRAQHGPAADHALTESDVAAPVDLYGRSKLAAEEAVRAAGVPCTILRPVVLYGPGSKGNFALLARAAASPWPLPFKNFSNRRSLLGIDNFVSAVAFVLAAPATLGQTYVVADPGEPPRLSDIFAVLRQSIGRRPLLLPLPPRAIEVPLRLMRRAELWDRLGGNLAVDPAKLLAAGWRPPHDSACGLTAMAHAAWRSASA
jgi:UDP-glucose 4-epimerase